MDPTLWRILLNDVDLTKKVCIYVLIYRYILNKKKKKDQTVEFQTSMKGSIHFPLFALLPFVIYQITSSAMFYYSSRV